MSLLQPLFITSLLLCFPAFHIQPVFTTNSLPHTTTGAPEQWSPEPSIQFASITLISKAVKLFTEPGPESSTSRQFLEPSTAPTIQPTTESDPESSTSPTIQPTTESVPESSATPTVQPTTEPVPESSTSPIIQPTTESVPESSTIPTIQLTTEPLPESLTNPTAQPITEPVPEPSTTPISQPITEPVPELSTVPIIQPTTVLISEISRTPTAQTTVEAILGKTSLQPVQHTQGNTLTIIGKPSTLSPVLLPESSTLETSSFKATVTQTVPKSTSQNIVPLEAKVGVNKTGMLWKTIVIVLIMMAGIATIACVLWGVSTTSKSKRKSDGEWDVCGGDRADGGEDGSLEQTVRDESGSPGLVLVSFIPKDSGVGATGTKEERRWNEAEALLFIDEDSN
nr:flocculation protein FLO11-like [Paramormyrops kingsleyae]